MNVPFKNNIALNDKETSGKNNMFKPKSVTLRLKGVFAKNERGYRLNAIFYSLYFIIFYFFRKRFQRISKIVSGVRHS